MANGRLWTLEEDRVIREMAADGCQAEDIAQELGRSRDAVYHRLHQLGVRCQRSGRLEPDARAVVLGLLAKGVSTAREIARRSGRSVRATQYLLGRLAREGLVVREPWDRRPNWRVTKVWRMMELDDLPDEVLDLASGVSRAGAEEVARRFGHKKQSVQSHVKRLKEKRSMPTQSFPIKVGDEVRLATGHPLSNGKLGRVVEFIQHDGELVGAVLETNWDRPNDRDGTSTKLFRAAWHEMEPTDVTEYLNPHANGNGRHKVHRNGKARTHEPAPTGDPCPDCGGINLVRTGTCVTCQDCGRNEGCG